MASKIEGASLEQGDGGGSIMDVAANDAAGRSRLSRRRRGGAEADADERLERLGRSLLCRTGSGGVPARTALFEYVVVALAALITRHREPDTEVLRLPPVMSRREVEKSGYLHSFPHLLGCVCGLHGEEAEIHAAVGRSDAGAELVDALRATDLVLTPAACYPVYPLAAGAVACRRRAAPSTSNPIAFAAKRDFAADRLEAFRMREYVCIGSPDQVVAFRSRWLDLRRSRRTASACRYRIAPASDPFFGRAARLIAASQVEQLLKFELLVPLRSPERRPPA